MLYVKALHIVAMVAWFAGIFYLPRLFVYHAMAATEPATCASFVVMERKLLWAIMAPSAVLTLALGGVLAAGLGWQGFVAAGWLHAKLVLVLLLVAFHGQCIVHQRAFARAANRRSHRYFRVFNELPVVLLIGIVVLVVVKPG